MKSNEKTVDTEEISEEFSHLEEEKFKTSIEPSKDKTPSFQSEFQGKQTAKIVGVNVKETRRRNQKKIVLELEAEDGTHKHRIKNTREYNQNNPFIRFLEYYDISLSTPSELIGKEVTMLKKRNTWRMYYPDSLDKYTLIKDKMDIIARTVGIQFFWRANTNDILITAVLVLTFSSMITLPASDIISSLSGVSLLVIYPLFTFLSVLISWILLRSYSVTKRRIRRKKQSGDMPD